MHSLMALQAVSSKVAILPVPAKHIAGMLRYSPALQLLQCIDSCNVHTELLYVKPSL